MHLFWGFQSLGLLAPFSHHAGELMAPILNSCPTLSSLSSLQFSEVRFFFLFFFKAFFQGPGDSCLLDSVFSSRSKPNISVFSTLSLLTAHIENENICMTC